MAQHTIAIASGKGGVGKSTIAVNVAVALAQDGYRTGLLDADMYGPDVPRMLGLTRRADARHVDVWTPPEKSLEKPVQRYGVSLMSTQFLVGEAQGVDWPSALVGLLLDRFFDQIAWGDLDYLIIDLPPGTGDVQQHLVQGLRLSGAVIVVTPQDVAHLDAKKVLSMLARTPIPVLGGVENMGPMRCPCCESDIELFPRVAENRSIWATGVALLARLRFAMPVAAAGEEGKPVVVGAAESEAAAAFRALANELVVRSRGRS